MKPAPTIATELIALLERFAAHATLPRVRALHLPRPECLDSRQGEFCALELDDGALGLAFVLLGDTWARLSAGAGVAGLVGADALEVARRYAGDDAVGRTLGMAAINALSRWVFDRVGYSAAPSADSIGELDPRPGDRVGMVGLFRPLLGRCTAAGAAVTVVELRADLVGEHDGYRVTLDAAELGRCNKVMCTSSVLLNGTVERILRHCANAAQVAMIGPGAGCLPGSAVCARRDAVRRQLDHRPARRRRRAARRRILERARAQVRDPAPRISRPGATRALGLGPVGFGPVGFGP